MKKILEKIFNIKRLENRLILTILGIKITYKLKPKIKKTSELLAELNNRIENIEFKQNLIMDYFIDASNAAVATGELRKFQLQCIELLKTFAEICEGNNLTYWLDFGSLLGAVRHNGFIPWDDDLDVSMTQSSFEKLRKIAPSLVPDHIVYVDREPGRMARFQYKENSNAFLDIYCYMEKEDFLCTTLPFVNLYCRKPIKKDILLPIKQIEFEGKNYSAPNDTDTYLRIRYGNFSLLPKKPNKEYGHTNINEHLE